MLESIPYEQEGVQFKRRSHDEVEGQINMWDYMAEMDAQEAENGAQAEALRQFQNAWNELREAERAWQAQVQKAGEAVGTADAVAERNKAETLKGRYDQAYDTLMKIADSNGFRELENSTYDFIRQYVEDKSPEQVAASIAGMQAQVEKMRHDGKANKAEINRMERVIRRLQSKRVQDLVAQREHYQQMMQNERDARRLAAEASVYRRRIARRVGRVNDLIIHETDYRNVPEEYKPLAIALVGAFLAHDAVKSMEADPKHPGHMRRTADYNGTNFLTDARSAAKLLSAYAALAEDKANPVYDDEIMDELADALATLQEYGEASAMKTDPAAGVTRVTKAQAVNAALEKLDFITGMLCGEIEHQRQIFRNGKRVATAEAAKAVVDPAMVKKDARTGKAATRRAIMMAQQIREGNMTPVYFFRWLDNAGLSSLADEIFEAENKYGLTIGQAKATMAEIADKHHYHDWAGRDGRKLQFTTVRGANVTLTVEQAMSLYAIWKREHIDTAIGSTHLESGGFVFQSTDRNASRVQTFTGTRLTQTDMDTITGWLTEEQKAFADEMVGFITNDMGALGNKASMALYGIRKYTEKYYFPIQSYSGNLHQRSDAGNASTTNDSRLVHGSQTIRRVKGANNPVLLTDFTDVISGHVNKMATYAHFAPAIESLNRVLNYRIRVLPDGSLETIEIDRTTPEKRKNRQLPIGESGETSLAVKEAGIEAPDDSTSPMSVRSLIGLKYGDGAQSYLQTFLADLNGGPVSDPRDSAMGKLIKTFKAGAVVGSLSVAAQQPLSYIRAAAVMNPAYLAMALADVSQGGNAEMLKYSGIANIKAAGRFDTGVGQSAMEWISPKEADTAIKAAKQKMDEVTGFLPELGDRAAWVKLWKATKIEQSHLHPDMDVKSEEFLTMCAARFNEIIRLTQVYDSTLSKSSLMRSKNPMMQMMTAFMAEPTLTMNMLFDSISGLKNGRVHINPARAAVCFVVSAVFQALIKGFFSAIRKDDDEKTLMEKWAAAFGRSFGDEINPLTSLVLVQDLWAALNGEEVTNDAFAVISDLRKAWDNLRGGKYVWTDPDGNQRFDLWRAMENFGGSLAKFAGIPLKNVMRDLRGLTNLAETAIGQDLPVGVGSAKRTSSLNTLAWIVLENMGMRDASLTAYGRRYYEALKAGDTEAARNILDYLTGYGGKEVADVNTGTRKVVKGELLAGNLTEDEAVDFIADNKLLNVAKDKEDTPEQRRHDAFSWMREAQETKVSDVWLGYLDAGDAAGFKAETKRLTEDFGYTSSNLSSSITSHYKPLYLAALERGDKAEAARIKSLALTAYEAIGYDPAKKIKDIEKWK